MKIIFKYDLEHSIKQTVFLPFEAKILSIQEQHGRFKLWALVDTEANPEGREILIIGTGVPFDKYYEGALGSNLLPHIATVQSGVLVFHFFENKMPF